MRIAGLPTHPWASEAPVGISRSLAEEQDFLAQGIGKYVELSKSFLYCKSIYQENSSPTWEQVAFQDPFSQKKLLKNDTNFFSVQCCKERPGAQSTVGYSNVSQPFCTVYSVHL
jgi:hypothetical protein